MAEKHPDSHEERKPTSAVVVSYVPLLAQSFLAGEWPSTELTDRLHEIDQCPDGHVDGCLWLAEGERVVPVFIMERAHAIADHILMWSEQRPEEWFTLCFCEREKHYATVLFPNIQNSVVRFRLNWLQQFEEFITPEQFHVIFRYLHFASGPQHVFHRVRSRIADRNMLGFIDTSDVNPQKPSDVNPACIKTLGPFQVSWDCKSFGMNISDFMDEVFAP